MTEELFEHERVQPFRGWGHTWPGHFLPSDRVGWWGDRLGKPGGSASMVFEQVEPVLPHGWKWLEERWEVDMGGRAAEAVDTGGQGGEDRKTGHVHSWGCFVRSSGYT